ncbi:hypothetical protein [Deinococcus misasensis]|uniref:hypothetical protein n=1 Tax=Deinococcus misasensis TaxID=392413 RepID=UPI000B2A5CFB|nr:hypothetical protein [Deinococcus misasensis]
MPNTQQPQTIEQDVTFTFDTVYEFAILTGANEEVALQEAWQAVAKLGIQKPEKGVVA